MVENTQMLFVNRNGVPVNMEDIFPLPVAGASEVIFAEAGGTYMKPHASILVAQAKRERRAAKRLVKSI